MIWFKNDILTIFSFINHPTIIPLHSQRYIIRSICLPIISYICKRKKYLNGMDIYIIKKKLGSRKELGRHPVEIDETVNTLGALLYILTLQGLTEAQTLKENYALSDSEIAAQVEEGRIRFAENYGKNNDTMAKAMERTKQAYDDGLFKVFINGEEVTEWNGPITLCQGTEVVFLRLTMLTGLYF